jgi:mRNA-degrading endonuclease RelE of RelBE toxin-antitoxin system
MNVIVTKSFARDLKLLPKQTQTAALKVVDILATAGSLEETPLDYIKCKGGKNNHYYRIRIGNYRIGIKYKSPDVLMMCCIIRGEVYKHFPPK